jgi:tetratricopeptide (TPR) repeat protein
LIPSSGLVPLPDFVAEHRTYLPSLGLMVIAACLLDRFFHLKFYHRPVSRGAGLLAFVLVLVLAGVTWQRNGVWSSRVTLWEDTARKSPGRCRAWNNLGSAYFESRDLDKASAAFRRAIEIEPRFETPYYNLMLVHNHLHQFNETLAIHDALGRSSKDACSRVNVVFQYAISLVAVGRVQEAVENFHKVVHSDPSHLQAHISLGALYYDKRLYSNALKYWNAAIAIKPPDSTLQRLIQSAAEAVKSEVSRP